MNFTNLVILLFFFFSMCGSSHVYQGKSQEDSKLVAKGILELCMSIFGMTFMTPLFENFVISLVCAVGFSLFSIAYVASVFLRTKPEEPTMYVNGIVEDASERPALESRKHVVEESTMPNITKSLQTVFNTVQSLGSSDKH